MAYTPVQGNTAADISSTARSSSSMCRLLSHDCHWPRDGRHERDKRYICSGALCNLHAPLYSNDMETEQDGKVNILPNTSVGIVALWPLYVPHATRDISNIVESEEQSTASMMRQWQGMGLTYMYISLFARCRVPAAQVLPASCLEKA